MLACPDNCHSKLIQGQAHQKPRVAPPSTGRLTPVMKEAASEARNTMGAAHSSATAHRFMACRSPSLSSICVHGGT